MAANDEIKDMLDALEDDNETEKPVKRTAKKSTVKKTEDDRHPSGKKHKYAKGERATIIIQKEKGEGGDRPVPVGYNGKCFTIPRGVPVDVPAPLVDILMNAEETIHEWDSKNNTIHQRSAAAYPVAKIG